MTVRILRGDCRDRLKDLPDESVHCVVTSPPYWGLRDYRVDGQIGLEDTIPEYLKGMAEVFREVRRVLRKDGTLWLNMGDCYITSPPGTKVVNDKDGLYRRKMALQTGHGEDYKKIWDMKSAAGLKSKDLVGMPWRLAFALQDDGWYLRQDIIWSKPNPMPESVADRCTKAHEYLFLMSKSARYFFDQYAIAEPLTQSTLDRVGQENIENQAGSNRVPGKNGPMKAVVADTYTRNKRSVWEVTTQPFSEAHFATFPPALVEPCIKAGTAEWCCEACGAAIRRKVEVEHTSLSSYNGRYKEGFGQLPAESPRQFKSVTANMARILGYEPGCDCDSGVKRSTVLDPFGGAGTTGMVADRLQRDAVLIELNPEYADIAERRLVQDGGMFAEVRT